MVKNWGVEEGHQPLLIINPPLKQNKRVTIILEFERGRGEYSW
jgi:hypothetical protein